MYLTHFGLAEYPFGLTPDTSFVVPTTAHQSALNTLLVAIDSGEGFVKITGEVGSGKSLLCRRFLQLQSAKGAATAFIANPQLEPRTLMLAIGEELGLELSAHDFQFHLVNGMNAALLRFAERRQQVIVCIDEAQAIPIATLEYLRLLSNLETEKTKLMHVVLFGQPELDANLAHPSVRQLRQRIAFSYQLPGLSRHEVANYLVHRLRVAGYRGERDAFSPTAVRRLHKASRGTPRVLNILAHKSLLAAFGAGSNVVEGSHSVAAARDTRPLATHIGWWS